MTYLPSCHDTCQSVRLTGANARAYFYHLGNSDRQLTASLRDKVSRTSKKSKEGDENNDKKDKSRVQLKKQTRQ